MLFKKTLKVASATALWMVALLGANSAMAQATMLDTYAAEALTADVGATSYAVDAGADLSTTMVANERVNYYLRVADRTIYARVAPSGVMKFATGAEPALHLDTGETAANGTVTWTPGSALTGDNAGATASGGALRWDLPGSATLAGDTVRLRAVITQRGTEGDAEAMVTAMGAAGVSITIYDKQEDAHFGEGATHQTATANFFNVASAIDVKSPAGVPFTHTATAASRFTQFGAGPGKYPFGGFDIQIEGDYLNAAGTGLMAAAMAAVGPTDPAEPTAEETAQARGMLFGAVGINAAMSNTRFYGDAGFGFGSGFEFRSAADCTGDLPAPPTGTGIKTSPLSEAAEGEDPPSQTEVIGGIKIDPWYLCVTVDEDNASTIAEGSYSLDVSLAADLMNRLASPTASSTTGMAAATVRHDGTTVQIPYVTSYDGYTQRLVIVNRSKNDVGYSLSFRAEGDGMIDGDNPHTGMLHGETTTVLKMDELVTLTNPTRASATLVVEAPPGMIDAATTMVNKMDQSTDTVVLESR